MIAVPPCGQGSTEYRYLCTRDRGHGGAHVATDAKGKVLDTWFSTSPADKP